MNIKRAADVLRDVVNIGSWHVSAETLPQIGWLIEHGYLTADNDYEGPRLFPTDKGYRYIKRLEDE